MSEPWVGLPVERGACLRLFLSLGPTPPINAKIFKKEFHFEGEAGALLLRLIWRTRALPAPERGLR